MTSIPPADPDTLDTPLHALHEELGARMVRFAGYRMPVQYPQGLVAEHRHTREQASLFDVSHMGQISVSGPSAAAALEQILPIDVMDLGLNRQRYALLLAENGGILDDLMVVNRGQDYLLIVNANCKHEDLDWIQSHIGHECTVQALPDMALLALQGPQAGAVLQRPVPATSLLSFMQGTPFDFKDARGYITRSGYTGEDGFEISLPASHIEAFARWVLKQPGVQPAGLGARNTLRLEAGLCLYGTDMDATTTPTQATLNWSIPKVRRTGGQRAAGFIGADVVLPQIEGSAPVDTVRVGLHAMERVPVRDGTPLHIPDGAAIGYVTSGSLAPTLDRPIAMGYVPPAHAQIGTRIDALVRGKPVAMEVVPLPFVGTRYRKN
ncbi:glycine cleavage system aminomethyltransferase GcvT [Comamonas sp. CMM02]|uniref:glycine cleavage system aminomethyltransferase GcvT n=1 Tax=Comamonas sp. CMM02 TaxID=2769307 RepID=UPI001784C328|nr:glycine cleavage system aminomethyltransferase GcvT [Comamonas sp. CMM02]MBD9402638.1 glycine cleavage system aminomethyltransferase GcvT [Comamonas sp. CMM02]